jgi:hypothetical protein
MKRRSRRPPKGKLATAQDFAKINFEPWKRTPDMRQDELLPSDRRPQAGQGKGHGPD